MQDYIFSTIAGTLGHSARSWQKTLKRKASEGPWKEINILVRGNVSVSFSFDGRHYTDESIMVANTEARFYLGARAVRLRVNRAKTTAAQYTIWCRD